MSYLRLQDGKDDRNLDWYIVDALYIAFLVSSTAIVSVGIGVFGAYCAISGLLAAFNPARQSRPVAALVPHQGHVGGD
jgi:hypothetical protein